jgi:ABC-2 type transport system ATP-binding protein
LGPNGAGKTTTIEILEGILTPTDGEVEILGKRWEHDADAIRHQIGISLQETEFSEKLSVLETLTLFRSFYRHGLDPWDAVAQVSLEEKANTWIKKLSGGQKQRLAVASALVGDPQLLFLDEPTTGLDPQSRRQLWDIIRQFRGQGRTIMLTTHYMEEAERLCDRVAIVDHGKLIALGTPRELIAGLGGEHVVEFSVEEQVAAAPAIETWEGLPTVNDVRYDDHGFQLSVDQPHVLIPALLAQLERQGWRLASLTTRHASLDDVFVKLTGRQFEEAEENVA